MAPRKRPAAASVSDGAFEKLVSNALRKRLAPKDMTYGQLRAEVKATPGLREQKKVDGRQVIKTKQELFAELTMKQNADLTLTKDTIEHYFSRTPPAPNGAEVHVTHQIALSGDADGEPKSAKAMSSAERNRKYRLGPAYKKRVASLTMRVMDSSI